MKEQPTGHSSFDRFSGTNAMPISNSGDAHRRLVLLRRHAVLSDKIDALEKFIESLQTSPNTELRECADLRRELSALKTDLAEVDAKLPAQVPIDANDFWEMQSAVAAARWAAMSPAEREAAKRRYEEEKRQSGN
jgi:hypothetical protein